MVEEFNLGEELEEDTKEKIFSRLFEQLEIELNRGKIVKTEHRLLDYVHDSLPSFTFYPIRRDKERCIYVKITPSCNRGPFLVAGLVARQAELDVYTAFCYGEDSSQIGASYERILEILRGYQLDRFPNFEEGIDLPCDVRELSAKIAENF